MTEEWIKPWGGNACPLRPSAPRQGHVSACPGSPAQLHPLAGYKTSLQAGLGLCWGGRLAAVWLRGSAAISALSFNFCSGFLAFTLDLRAVKCGLQHPGGQVFSLLLSVVVWVHQGLQNLGKFSNLFCKIFLLYFWLPESALKTVPMGPLRKRRAGCYLSFPLCFRFFLLLKNKDINMELKRCRGKNGITDLLPRGNHK